MPFYEIGTLGDWLFGRDKLDNSTDSAPSSPAPAALLSSSLSSSASSVPPLSVSPSAGRRAPRIVQQKPWKIQHVLQQVLQGIAFLHQNHIIHRDIKYDISA